MDPLGTTLLFANKEETMRLNTKVILLGLLLIALSFFREFVFLNINEQSRVTYYHTTDSHVSPLMSFLENFSYPVLYYSKWFLTLFFPLLFMYISCMIVKEVFKNKNYIRWTIFSYAGVVGLSILLFALGWLFNFSEKGYTFARAIIGITESPVILMLLIPVFKIQDSK